MKKQVFYTLVRQLREVEQQFTQFEWQLTRLEPEEFARSSDKLLTRDEARRIAANVKLPENVASALVRGKCNANQQKLRTSHLRSSSISIAGSV
jgi:hypothetical protein